MTCTVAYHSIPTNFYLSLFCVLNIYKFEQCSIFFKQYGILGGQTPVPIPVKIATDKFALDGTSLNTTLTIFENHPAQQWYLYVNTDGTVTIRNVATG